MMRGWVLLACFHPLRCLTAASVPNSRDRESPPGRIRRRLVSGKSAQGRSLVATVRRRSAPTSLRPGSSAISSTSDQANTVQPGKQRCHVPAAIDRGHVERVGKAVKRERARQRNDVAAIDQPAAEAAFALGELVEMDARGVLVEPCRDHVLGFLHGDAVDVVDFFPDLVVAEAVRAAGQRVVIGRGIDLGQAPPSGAALRSSEARALVRPARAPPRRAFAPSPSAHSRAPPRRSHRNRASAHRRCRSCGWSSLSAR